MYATHLLNSFIICLKYGFKVSFKVTLGLFFPMDPNNFHKQGIELRLDPSKEQAYM